MELFSQNICVTINPSNETATRTTMDFRNRYFIIDPKVTKYKLVERALTTH
jgi:hypothetical protein